MTKTTIYLGRRIIEALTAEQIVSLIDFIGSKTLLQKIEETSGCLDQDIIDTVRNVITSIDTTGNNECELETGAVSDSKFIEEWDGLWQRWNAVVMDVGDEDGRYAEQERHWEPPYFDGSALASDLEKSRSSLVGRLCCTETVEKMLDIWKKLFSHLIPNPSTSSSDYLRPVAWVKVLFDLNPQAYSLLVGLWKVNHRRRINLWKAMRNAKLPVD